MRVLVTGGAGFIGLALVKRLLAAGEQVTVLDDGSRGDMSRIADLRIGYYNVDIRDANSVHVACHGVKEVIHLAYINGTKTFYDKPQEVLDVGVRGMLNILDACRAHNIKRFMLASSSEVCRTKIDGMDEAIPLVIPDPFCPRYSYSAGKIISEMMAIHSKQFDWLTIFRPFNIYGSNMSLGHAVPDFSKQLRERMAWSNEDPLPFTILGSANETRSFCHINDLIDGIILIREKGKHNGIYNIGTPEEVTIGELAQKMANVYGRRLRIIQAQELREGSIARRKPNIDKLKELGYNPKIGLDEGLKMVLLGENNEIDANNCL